MSAGAFRCGHPRSVENNLPTSDGYIICRKCQYARQNVYRMRQRAMLTPEERRFDREIYDLPMRWRKALVKLESIKAEVIAGDLSTYKRRHRPAQIAAMEAKIAALEAEAGRLGITHKLIQRAERKAPRAAGGAA